MGVRIFVYLLEVFLLFFFFASSICWNTRERLKQAETHRHGITAGGLFGVSDPAGPHHPRQSVILVSFWDMMTEFLSLKILILKPTPPTLNLSVTVDYSVFILLYCFVKHSSFGSECDFKIQNRTFLVVIMSCDSLLFCGTALMWRVPLPWRHHSSLRNWLHRLTYLLNWLPRSLCLSFSHSFLFNAVFKDFPCHHDDIVMKIWLMTKNQCFCTACRKYNSVDCSWVLMI